MYTVYIRTSDRYDPFIETVRNYMFDEKGNLKLYNNSCLWFFPYQVLQYVCIKEVEDEEIKPD